MRSRKEARTTLALSSIRARLLLLLLIALGPPLGLGVWGVAPERVQAATLLLVAAGALLAAWVLGDVFLLRHLLARVDAARGLAAGHLDTRSGLGREPGALGRLAREFDDMAASLEKRQDEAVRAAEGLRQSELRKSAILEGALECVIGVDEGGRLTEWNPAAEQTFGLTRAEVLGREAVELLVPPASRARFRAEMAALLEHGDAPWLRHRVEALALRADGGEFPAELSVTQGAEGGRHFTAFLRDVTERRRAEQELRRARDELQKRVEERTAELRDANEKLVSWVEELQQRTQDMMRLGEFGDVLRACHTLDEAYAVVGTFGEAIFPRQPGALCVHTAPNLLESVAYWGDPPPHDQVFAPEDCWALRRGRPHIVESEADARLVCPHVSARGPTSYMCIPMMAQGVAQGILYLVSPEERASSAMRPHLALARRQLATTVAEQTSLGLSNLRLQETLRAQAIRDPLTGLFNRRYMEESLERELRRAARRGIPLGVVMLDIDHFKRFNDTHGHGGGDAVLREIGTLLQAQTRGEDLACRYGGEEFTLIFVEASRADTEQRAGQLLDEARRLRVVHHHQALGGVTLSLGVAVFPEHGQSAEALLAAADAALYRAKGSGRDRVVVAW